MPNWEYLELSDMQISKAVGSDEKHRYSNCELVYIPNIYHYLNDLGVNGWELVSVNRVVNDYSRRSVDETTYYFERPLNK